MDDATLTPDCWAPLKDSQRQSETLGAVHRTFAKDVWFRFRKKPAALIGLGILTLVLLFALVGPYFTGHDFDDQELAFVNIPPRMDVFVMGEDYVYLSKSYKPILVSPQGHLLRSLPRIAEDLSKKQTTYDFDGQVLTVDFSARPPRLIDPQGERVRYYVTLWNRSYILGTDNLGRDLLTRLMMGARISLLVAFIAALVNLVIGILYGGISGYLGGNADLVMMRIVDVISTIPLTLYVILIMVVLPIGNSGIASIVIALGSVYWVNMARVVRGQILSLKEQDFVHAAVIMGTSNWRILTRHLIPNAMGPIIVTVTMLIPSAIFIEAFMSFIGLGVSPPMASWGTMCNDALEALRTNPYQLFAPALAICATMFGFNFVGDGLRDALDPKLKGR
ncbi:MAG: ABC transporter permease [Spirochaetales bacterium]|nr:ABC transporter permease [Spirochaetales bacterium]